MIFARLSIRILSEQLLAHLDVSGEHPLFPCFIAERDQPVNPSWTFAGHPRRFFGKAVFVALFGLFAGVEIDLSYWNWYGFPTSYTLSYIVQHVIGWFLAGLVLGFFFKKPAMSQPAM